MDGALKKTRKPDIDCTTSDIGFQVSNCIVEVANLLILGLVITRAWLHDSCQEPALTVMLTDLLASFRIFFNIYFLCLALFTHGDETSYLPSKDDSHY